MANIYFAYKNLLENVTKISELYGTTDSTNFGTSKIADFDLNTSFRSNGVSGIYGTTTIQYDFGSSVYVDTLIAVHNFTTGTVYVKAGGTSDPNDMTYGLPVDGGVAGTSIRYLATPVAFRYWKLYMEGSITGGYHELNEMFLGKRLSLTENPSYPFGQKAVEDIIINEAEKGQRFIYHNFSRKSWDLTFESINQDNYENLIKMRRYCGGMYKPLWFCIDADDDPVSYKLYIGTDPGFADVTPIKFASDSNNHNSAMALRYSISMIGLFWIIAVGGLFKNKRKLVLIIIPILLMTGFIFTSCGSSGGGNNNGNPESNVNNSYESYTVNLQPNTTYYWKVSADDGKGDVTESDTYSFTT